MECELPILNSINNLLNYLIAQNGFKNVFDAGFYEVHRSNMSKLENGKPIYKSNGKVAKSSTYFKPDLKSILV